MVKDVVYLNRLIFKTLLLLAVLDYQCIHAKSARESPPLMIKQPPTNEVLFQVASCWGENDKPFLIECEAEGDPPPQYIWVKNGKEFNWQAYYDDRISQQPGKGTLVITSPRDEDTGQFQCYAKTKWGVATSNSVFVRKAELSPFEDDVVRTVVADEGKPYQLPCNPPDGWPKPKVYWVKQKEQQAPKSINSSRITVDPEGHLWFSNVTIEDQSSGYFYVCVAFSPFRDGYRHGNRVWLQVNSMNGSTLLNKQPPRLQYTSKRNMIALTGEDVEFWCIIGGTPLPKINWSKKDSFLSNDRVLFENFGKTMRITDVDFGDEGSYNCDASNGVGMPIFHTVQLTVFAIPYFTVEPEIANAVEGETVQFQCEAYGRPIPEIKWVHNGKPLEQSDPNPRRRVIGSSTIVIENLREEDTGNYGCNATNSFGYVYKDVYVSVISLPAEIIESPGLVVATLDASVILLRCRVFGSPKPMVRWTRDGQKLTHNRYKQMGSGDLEISSVKYDDAGNYTCSASNKYGADNSSAHLVVIKYITRIMNPPKDYVAPAGANATFGCSAIADPNLTLTFDWLSDNQTIEFDVEQRYMKLEDNSLAIEGLTELDSGVYTCLARTEFDSARADAILVVQDVPNRPELTRTRCAGRNATIWWKAMGDNGSPISHYTIEYRTSFTPDSWKIANQDVSATESSYTFTMSSWANYTFRVIAQNTIGPSLQSMHSDICAPPPAVPSKNPDNVKGYGMRPDILVISWTPIPMDEHNAPNFGYVVEWKLQDDSQMPESIWVREEIRDWRRDHITIPNQPTNRQYSIRVRAINEQGEANIAPTEVIGWSGQGEATSGSATKSTLKNVTSAITPAFTHNATENDAKIVIIIVTFASILIMVVIAGLTIYRRKVKTMEEKLRELTDAEIEIFFEGNLNADEASSGYGFIESQPFNKDYEIPSDQLKIFSDNKLGAGAFGLVLRGTLKGSNEAGSKTAVDIPVAVKTVKPNVEVSIFVALLTEMKVMCFVGQHPHIVALYGAQTTKIRTREVYIALEFCANGDLLNFLKKHRTDFNDMMGKANNILAVNPEAMSMTAPFSIEMTTISMIEPPSVTLDTVAKDSLLLTTLDLLKWAQQISNGMAFLGSKKVIHGDLAARNVLITEGNIAKISDFGLSRQLNYSTYKKKTKTPLPWKWMAIESLRDSEYSIQSDVWSFGVTLYEIFSLGTIPYPGRNWTSDFVDDLVAGLRLTMLKFGNDDIFNMMMDCMKLDPLERLKFEELGPRFIDIQRNFLKQLNPDSFNNYVVT